MEFWCKEVIDGIANTLGNLIAGYPSTRRTRMIAARFCVNMDFSKQLSNTIAIKNEDGEWIQHITYKKMKLEAM